MLNYIITNETGEAKLSITNQTGDCKIKQEVIHTHTHTASDKDVNLTSREEPVEGSLTVAFAY